MSRKARIPVLRPFVRAFALVASAACCAAIVAHAADPTAPAAAPAKAPDPALQKEAAAYLESVTILADDKMEGRGLGTKGIGLAANYIEKQLKSAGLKPGFGKSYRQKFPVKIGVEKLAGNAIDGLKDDEWTPLGFSSPGAFSGELAFVGYGIEAAPLGYQELDGIDLKGKVALILRYEPQEKDEGSPFDGKRPSRWSALRYKAMQARERGAVAVVFTTGPLQDEGNDKIPALKNDGPESPAGIPIIQVKTSTAQRWLSTAGIDLADFQKQVDRDLTPRSRASTGVTVKGNVAIRALFAEGENLVGLIPGAGSLAGEYVVIGAHYDHLGYGGQGSMRPNEKAIHNGADDNASGTAAVLMAGAALKKSLAKVHDRRAVAVMLFSGEEVGLAGSAYLAENPPFPMTAVRAMVNLDMVGRLRGDSLVALGAESATQWKDYVKHAATVTNLTVTASGDGYGPSDQTSFYAKGVPVLHLFTGTHAQYHSPDDDAALINAVGGAVVTRFAETLVGDLAGATPATAPVYARSTAAPTMSGDSRGYGAYLGTVPDFRAMESTEGGVLLADVRAGGPGERAGIKGGDRIMMIAGTKIANLYDMTYALQDHKPGQTVDVVVIRDGKEQTFRATLGDRSAVSREGASPAPTAAPAAAPAAAAAATPSAMPPAATPAAPENPHAMPPSGAPAAGDSAKSTLAPFFEGRPGPDWTPGAGTPFTATFPGEKHFKEIRQLTFGGENAEPYFAPDGKHITFQATPRGAKCDQQYVMDLTTGETKMISSGKGRTTCGYYDYPEQDRIVFGSTEAGSDSCPPAPDMSQGYVWAIYPSYDLWEVKPDGTGLRRIMDSPGYDAEVTWNAHGGKAIFTSMRDGDLDLYEMDEAGGVKRITSTPGYDGGAFFSPDGSEIVWRASRPEGKALDDYRALLAKGLIRPSALEIFVMKSDGTNVRQLTKNGAANFCPTFLADGNRIIWSSNQGGDIREFDLWMIDKRGGEQERITTGPGFDGFPHFSPDGRWIVWSSNRADPASHETNLFIARWVDE
ncbi:MAG TPA: M28 family peptidase [Candidatus Eisenbacteria bacterium]|nr:M28 family peptidase [Candidatus Eisenbacteria bacterium]